MLQSVCLYPSPRPQRRVTAHPGGLFFLSTIRFKRSGVPWVQNFAAAFRSRRPGQEHSPQTRSGCRPFRWQSNSSCRGGTYRSADRARKHLTGRRSQFRRFDCSSRRLLYSLDARRFDSGPGTRPVAMTHHSKRSHPSGTLQPFWP